MLSWWVWRPDGRRFIWFRFESRTAIISGQINYYGFSNEPSAPADYNVFALHVALVDQFDHFFSWNSTGVPYIHAYSLHNCQIVLASRARRWNFVSKIYASRDIDISSMGPGVFDIHVPESLIINFLRCRRLHEISDSDPPPQPASLPPNSGGSPLEACSYHVRWRIISQITSTIT